MQLPELHNQIVNKCPDKFLIFTGEEYGIMDIYLDKVIECCGGTKVRTDSMQSVNRKLQQKKLTSDIRCFIVRDDENFLKADKVWNSVEHNATNSADYVILIYTSLDKRGKFYKRYQDKLVEFAKLTPAMLVKYIAQQLVLNEKNALQLAEICECDYSRILLECDKINQYAKSKQIDHNLSFTTLVNKGVIFKPVGDITFNLTDAILTRNVKAAELYLAQSKLIMEPEIKTLSILYNSFKQILMVQALDNPSMEPSKRTGLTPWQVKMAKEKWKHYSIDELISIIQLIRSIEMGIKTGTIDNDISVEYLICKIMEE